MNTANYWLSAEITHRGSQITGDKELVPQNLLSMKTEVLLPQMQGTALGMKQGSNSAFITEVPQLSNQDSLENLTLSLKCTL